METHAYGTETTCDRMTMRRPRKDAPARTTGNAAEIKRELKKPPERSGAVWARPLWAADRFLPKRRGIGLEELP